MTSIVSLFAALILTAGTVFEAQCDVDGNR